MHCPACGVEVIEQAVYCHRCGQRLEPPSQEPSAGAREGAGTPAPDSPDPRERLQRAIGAETDRDAPAETELWEGSYSPRAMLGAWTLSIGVTVVLLLLGIWAASAPVWKLLIAGILVLWLYQWAVLMLRRLGVRYLLTNQRLLHETGILRRVTDRIEVLDVDDVTLEQGLVERLLGIGTIRVVSSDRTHPELLLRGIDNAKHVANLLDDVRRNERRRRGLHIEQI